MVTYDGGKISARELEGTQYVWVGLYDAGGLDGSPPEGHDALLSREELDKAIRLLCDMRDRKFGSAMSYVRFSDKTLGSVPDEQQSPQGFGMA
jgi:hypothetical protein